MAKFRDPKVRAANQYVGVKRTARRPQHTFHLRTRPFQVQPFLLAPVFPAETLRNFLLQSRVVSKPISDPLVGWWTEYFLFYVKLRDLDFHNGNELFAQMILNPATDMAAVMSSAEEKTYHPEDGINFTRMCLECVTEWYFRDQGEDWDAGELDGLPLTQVSQKSWLDGLTLDPDLRPIGVDTPDLIHEVGDAMAHWQALRDAGLEEMDYEDYIRTYGVAIREVDTSSSLWRPELVRYSRNWSYPTNVVDPTTGTPTSAVSWAVAFRGDKDRFFREHGFLFGVKVSRPKVYVREQTGQLSHMLRHTFNWLPAVLQHQKETGFLKIDGDSGPLLDLFDAGGGNFHDYTVDIRDLLNHGDQFINFDPETASAAMGLVTADGHHRYPSAETIDGLFSGEEKFIQEDGICSFTIASRHRDTTPSGQPLTDVTQTA